MSHRTVSRNTDSMNEQKAFSHGEYSAKRIASSCSLGLTLVEKTMAIVLAAHRLADVATAVCSV